MTYQALARKWRPKSFVELSGQEHVVRALTNALERGRLHHAYLLTGTRGVGKTTIARILAKSLNCITNGVTATPCGTCAACVDIDAGRFVDLLELDAASNTGIDNMREILDNARYAPTVGRYKVYLIDEVHMLSKAAFNSMLKTLEEPPEHVKFVLATTDPQKIPVTVLSRCLQFNLKLLPAPLIAARLDRNPARGEASPSTTTAVALIARMAHGSMRDALSVLDQAIAYGAGEVREAAVRAMLGAVDADYCYRIADALLAGDGPALLAEARALTERSVSHAVGARRAGRALSSHRDRAGGSRRGRCAARCGARRRLCARVHARRRAARLPDLRAGTRRPRARARRADRLCDDAAASARVRARRQRGQSNDATERDAAPRPRARTLARAAACDSDAPSRQHRPTRCRARRRATMPDAHRLARVRRRDEALRHRAAARRRRPS